MSRYAPSSRLLTVRAMLHAGNGVSIASLMERLEIGRSTAKRLIAALVASGEPLYEEVVGKEKVWRLEPSARHATLKLTTSELTSLFLSLQVFDFLEGTGFKEDLESIFAKVEKILADKDRKRVPRLRQKLYYVNEAPLLLDQKSDEIDEIVSALLREDRLEVVHKGRTLVLEPYSLVIYKKALYLTAKSAHHSAIRTFAIDRFDKVQWRRGDRFEYPEDWNPRSVTSGAFGLIGGDASRVVVRFSAKVAPYVTRRKWHPTQSIERLSNGDLTLSMEVHGTVEVLSWILAFGEQAEVLSPPELRESLAEAARATARLYAR
jgi:proteasome accessory factor B